jgi:hypothetical protein
MKKRMNRKLSLALFVATLVGTYTLSVQKVIWISKASVSQIHVEELAAYVKSHPEDIKEYSYLTFGTPAAACNNGSRLGAGSISCVCGARQNADGSWYQGWFCTN